MLYLTRTMISSVNLAHYGVSRAKDLVSVDCGMRYIIFFFKGSNSFNLGCDIWTRAGQYCYMFFKGPLSTWQAARQNCRSIQGDLINVKDIDTQVC